MSLDDKMRLEEAFSALRQQVNEVRHTISQLGEIKGSVQKQSEMIGGIREEMKQVGLQMDASININY